MPPARWGWSPTLRGDRDSPTGARAARAAGMTCFGYVPDGSPEALVAEGARPFSDMRELPALLGL